MLKDENYRAVSWGRGANGKPLIVVGGKGKVVRVFSGVTGKEVSRCYGFLHEINDVKFKRDDCRFVAGASNDRTVRLWYVPSSTLVAIFNTHICEVLCVEWNPSSTIFASSSDDRICLHSFQSLNVTV